MKKAVLILAICLIVEWVLSPNSKEQQISRCVELLDKRYNYGIPLTYEEQKELNYLMNEVTK